MKVTLTAIRNFIKGSGSRCNAYPKDYVVRLIFGILNETEPRKELYRDHEWTFGNYTEKRGCSGRIYYFLLSERKLSDNLGNVLQF